MLRRSYELWRELEKEFAKSRFTSLARLMGRRCSEGSLMSQSYMACRTKC
jgi:hypothetical protein